MVAGRALVPARRDRRALRCRRGRHHEAGIDDTGGIVEHYQFGVAGFGLELVSRFGLSASIDVQGGPEHRSGWYRGETWLFERRLRLGLGYQF